MTAYLATTCRSAPPSPCRPPTTSSTLLSNTGGTTATAPISGQFTYRNAAAVGNGSQPVYWSAYYSTLNTLNGTTEVLIDSGIAAQQQRRRLGGGGL